VTDAAAEFAQLPYGRLHAAIASGRFVVTAELDPPRGADAERVRRKARVLRDWVDAANVTDNQGASVRLASWAGCVIAREEGLEPVMQVQCRDRNRMAMQSDLLGAAAAGIPNVLLLTGDHFRFGDHPEAKPVFDLDSVQLVWTARTMRDEGKLLSGRTLSPRPRWLIGAVENPFSPPQRFRAERLGKKVAAGAQFVQTQYVFDVPQMKAFVAQCAGLGLTDRCAVIAGVGPIRSPRALARMLEIPGISIPAEVVRRLEAVPEDRFFEESVALCVEIVTELRGVPGIAGVHIMAFGREEVVPEIMERAGLERRPPVPGRPETPTGQTTE
jgi:methylenetetrahydrofolate reductase (NADPH)